MFIDSNLEFCDGTDASLDTGDGTTKLGSHLDIHPLGSDNATVDFSAGEPIYLVIEVTTTFVGSGASYNLRLVSSSETALTGGTTSNIWTTGAEGIATFAAGKRYIVSLPEHEYQRYLGITGTATGANVTAGAINAYLTKDVENWQGTATRVPATDPAN
jgi:hypothetical protein